jgi:hypothetical protein
LIALSLADDNRAAREETHMQGDEQEIRDLVAPG